jgi:hypothetical protein
MNTQRLPEIRVNNLYRDCRIGESGDSLVLFVNAYMSKGIGPLQRRILDNLDHPPSNPESKHPVGGTEVEPGVYDLRIVARYVVGGDAAIYFAKPVHFDPAFRAAFSRAVRSLVRRGELVDVWEQHPLWNGCQTMQVRFVRRDSDRT